MTTIRRFLLRLLSFFRAGAAEAELSREIHSHLQLLEDVFVSKGTPREEAQLAARRAFDGVFAIYAADGNDALPYFLNPDMPLATYMYVALLTGFTAVVAGVLPALHATE